jgi:ABC-2 type transport system permease protein
MENLSQALWVETLKARRSGMVLFSTLAVMAIPLMGGLFMVILKDPELARQLGLISVKAQLLAGTADWPTLLSMLSQATAIGGTILFGFIVSWVFGREYADRTVRDLLALPTPRTSVALAKLALVIGWSTILALLIYVVGLGIGALVGLPPAAFVVFRQGTLNIAVAALLTIALLPAIAYFAGVGHGYLAPLAASVAAIVLAQLAAVLGWGEYFPWAVPALVAMGEPVGPVSYLLVLLTGIAGAAATLIWWQRADQLS